MKPYHPILLLLLLNLPPPAHADTLSKADFSLDLTFATIPAGEFIMGTSDLKAAIADLPRPDAEVVDDESPAHKVIFEQSFQLSKTPVTQKMWLAVMGTKPGPKFHWQADEWQQFPVVDISWYEANEFIKTVNEMSSEYSYRLPTEAEWEYAARAGNTDLRPFSILAMDEYAWYIHNSNDEIQAVAQLEPNAWGLYDMYGNVWEWVSDWYSPTAYKTSSQVNPQGPRQGTKKVRRGGSFHCPPHMIRSAYRAANTPTASYSVTGFRLVANKK